MNAGPKRNCDIVMKGGVTSGVVYPGCVVEIAKRFNFKNIGGTSAGAIAAVLTAAAQRRRIVDSDAGFDQLATIPDELAKDNLLFHLFTPDKETKALFNTIVALAGRPKFQPAWLSKACSLAWAYKIATVLGAVPGVLLLLRSGEDPLVVLIALLAIAGGVVVADVISLAFDVLKRLPKNSYGLVTGVDDADRNNGNALSVWLEQRIEETAGLPKGIPLTFEMLWNPQSQPIASGLASPPEQRAINLEMIATHLTYGRPYRWPTKTSNLYFRPEEMLQYFPDHVVEWMCNHPRSGAANDTDADERHQAFKDQGFCTLPAIGDLPVIVVTRMSLSFPILLSPVPLYSVDYRVAVPKGQPPALSRVWFTDGGLSSNFPITLFDAPLPQWPTFAINLRPLPGGVKPDSDESKNVTMVPNNGAGRQPDWNSFANLTGFGAALLNAMQNWNDSSQMILPGYRDRIVSVMLADFEGGLNLDMPAPVLTSLKERGKAAGRMIAARFADPDPAFAQSDAPNMNWHNHRWLRFRTTMGAIREYLSQFSGGFASSQPGDSSYTDLIKESEAKPGESYPLPVGSAQEVLGLAQQLQTAGVALANDAVLEDRLPHPPPELAIRPTLDSPVARTGQ